MAKKTKKKSIHYVNNKEFLAAVIERKELIKEAESVGDPPPQISNYLGECILKIANHLSFRPNFINYTYREEMISDGIENCLQYIDRFDPEKSSNPFAYFTQIIYYAFVRRILKEKKQQKIKEKLLKESNIESRIALQAHDDEREYQQQFVEMLDKYTFHQDE
ncbi:MAG: sigma factor for late transcription [Parcubacteria group bacterium]|jgi:hypothetical protein|nr:sigma factor for late transcription [Parcubacteria group bacterium]|tara:strand:- start:200 stop:688 length:489 start_codon:yes stop_codon:yes gene_type:complete